MKLNKTFFLVSLVYFLFSSIIISQSVHFDELSNSSTLAYYKKQIQDYDLYKIDNNSSANEGSPFNNNINSQIDSVVLLKGISSGEETIKYFYTYDSCGNVATEIKENHWQKKLSYDSFGNMTLSIFKYWKEDYWLNDTRQINLFNSTGSRTLHLQKRWIDSIWVNEQQVKYFYNTRGDMTSYLSEDWNGSEWVNSFRRTNTYDSNFVLTSSLFQNWGNNDWTGFSWRESYSYDSNGNEILFFREILEENKWENADQFIYEYDKKDNKVSYLYEVWSGGMWISSFRYTLTYDNSKNLIFSQKETWESIKWVNSLQTKYSYNENRDLSFAKTERWVDNNWILSNGLMTIYDADRNGRLYFGRTMSVYYSPLTDLEEEELQRENYSLSQNYPNPFNPSTTIKYEIPKDVRGEKVEVRLVVYDVLGREVAVLVNEHQNTGSYDVQFDATNLTSGLYFYRLHVSIGSTTSFSKTKKLILLK